MKKPILVGLTGNIGTGKSTAAAMLGELGADVVSGDELGKFVLENHEAVKREVSSRFGTAILNEFGGIDRRKLGSLVFSSKEATRWLTKLLFPEIYSEWKKTIHNSARDVIVLDAALIFEWGIESEFDIVLLVTAPLEEIVRRAHGGRFSADEIRQRSLHQMSSTEVSGENVTIIENSGSKEQFRSKINTIWNNHIVPKRDSKHHDQ